jgi:hypothetical protein
LTVSCSKENMSQVRGNWLNAGNAQVLINHKILFEKIKSNNLLEKYDLFVSWAELTCYSSSCYDLQIRLSRQSWLLG